MSRSRSILLAAGLVLACGFLLVGVGVAAAWLAISRPASTHSPDLQTAPAVPTPPTTTLPLVPSPGAPAGDQPPGKIVFTCQLFGVQASNQVCLIEADGSGFRRLTADDNRQHLYPSLSSDGQYVVYSAFREPNIYEIYELDLDAGTASQLTDRLGVLNAAEISPDGQSIVFTRWTAASDKHTLWIMGRDGSNPEQFFDPDQAEAWDPTWSPDGKEILFASDMGGSNQLWIIGRDARNLRVLTTLPALRGRSDWSHRNQIVTYSGAPRAREVYLIEEDGSNLHPISPAGGNSQGPAFSPDGAWVAFTAYFDLPNDIHGCEIYIMRIDGTDLARLTDNAYCDYQPRWGP